MLQSSDMPSNTELSFNTCSLWTKIWVILQNKFKKIVVQISLAFWCIVAMIWQACNSTFTKEIHSLKAQTSQNAFWGENSLSKEREREREEEECFIILIANGIGGDWQINNEINCPANWDEIVSNNVRLFLPSWIYFIFVNVCTYPLAPLLCISFAIASIAIPILASVCACVYKSHLPENSHSYLVWLVGTR